METNCQSTSRASALLSDWNQRSMCRSCLQCILSSRWCESRHRSKQNTNSLYTYISAEIFKASQILPDPDWCAKTEDPGIVRCIFVDVRGHILCASVFGTPVLPNLLQEKDQHIDDALKKMDFAEEEPLMCQLSAIVPLSGFWSWAKPLTPGRTICGYFARRWGIWGILVVLVRNSWPVFPIYIYIYVCEFLLLLQFSSPQPFMTQGHLTPRPALKSLKY